MPRTITDSQHLKNLKSQQKPIFLFIGQSHNGDYLYEHYFAHGGFGSQPNEDDVNRRNLTFYPVIQSIAKFSKQMGDALDGQAKYDEGEIEITHDGGEYNARRYNHATDTWELLRMPYSDLIHHTFAGHQFSFYQGFDDYSFDDFRQIAAGFIDDDDLRVDDQYNYTLGFEDKMAGLEENLHDNKFSTGANEEETKPSAIGGDTNQAIFNVKGVLADNTVRGGEYSLHGDGPIEDITIARADNNPDTDYIKDLAHGSAILTSSPGKSNITFDVKGMVYPVGVLPKNMTGSTTALNAASTLFAVDTSKPLPRNKTFCTCYARKPASTTGTFWVLMVADNGSNVWEVKFGAQFSFPAEKRIYNQNVYQSADGGNAYNQGDIVSFNLADALATVGSADTPTDTDYYFAWYTDGTYTDADAKWYADTSGSGDVHTVVSATAPTASQTYTVNQLNQAGNVHICMGLELHHPADILEYLIIHKTRLTADDIDFDNFHQFKTDYPYNIGVAWEKEVKMSEIKSTILKSLIAFMFVDIDGKIRLSALRIPQIGATPASDLKQYHFAYDEISVASTEPRRTQASVSYRVNHFPTDQTDTAGSLSEDDKALFEKESSKITVRNSYEITGQIDGTSPPTVVDDAHYIVTTSGGGYTEGEIYTGVNGTWVVNPLYDNIVIQPTNALSGGNLTFTADTYYKYDGSAWNSIGTTAFSPRSKPLDNFKTVLLIKADAAAIAELLAKLYRTKRDTIEIGDAKGVGYSLQIGDMIAIDDDHTLVANKQCVISGLVSTPDNNTTNIIGIVF